MQAARVEVWGALRSSIPSFWGSERNRSTQLKTRGDEAMDLIHLVKALRTCDVLSARQWVSDATHSRIQLTRLARPSGLDAIEMAIAAGIVELLAARFDQLPPAWTREVGAAPEPVFLVQAARWFPRLRKLCETEGPEPLRRRQLLAPPDFLKPA